MFHGTSFSFGMLPKQENKVINSALVAPWQRSEGRPTSRPKDGNYDTWSFCDAIRDMVVKKVNTEKKRKEWR